MMPLFVRIKYFFRMFLNAIFGISEEIFLAYFFIVIGCIICFVWWSLFR